MKKLSILFTAIIAISITLVSWNKAKVLESSVHLSDFGCGMIDGDGGFIAATSSDVIFTSSGNANFKCSIKGAANSTGSAVHYDFASTGLLCGTLNGVTDQWKETVSANGNATLQCKRHPQ